MTRLERKVEEMKELLRQKEKAIQGNNLVWLHKNGGKIKDLEKEIADMRKQQTTTVFSVIADKDENVKNGIYKSLLRISLLADACNEACEQAYSLLKEHGITDFSFRNKVKELRRISADIAGVTIRTRNATMEDLIVDNETFVDMCIKHADAHLKRKLKI